MAEADGRRLPGRIYGIFRPFAARCLFSPIGGIDPDTLVRYKQDIGEVESSKAVSSLYAPCDGRVVAFNEKPLADPSVINTDNYEAGWLYEFETTAELLTPGSNHVELLAAGWEKTQQVIKGQMNE